MYCADWVQGLALGSRIALLIFGNAGKLRKLLLALAFGVCFFLMLICLADDGLGYYSNRYCNRRRSTRDIQRQWSSGSHKHWCAGLDLGWYTPLRGLGRASSA